MQRRLAEVDAQLPLYATVPAIRALAAELGGRVYMVDRVDRVDPRTTEDEPVAAIVDYDPDIAAEDVAAALARHGLTLKPVEVIAARAGVSPEMFSMVTDQLRDLSTAVPAPSAQADIGGVSAAVQSHPPAVDALSLAEEVPVSAIEVPAQEVSPTSAL